ncbi:MAG: PAS domain-containing protein [Anaerolineae bacterium]|nr:PAS domain-containing protein [Anaerolineae bacterium]
MLSLLSNLFRQDSGPELRQQVELFESIFGAMPVMIWVKDTQNNTLYINPAAAALEGVPVEHVVGKNARDVYPPEVAEAFYKDDQEVIRSGKPKLNILDRHVVPATQEVAWLLTGKVPLRDKREKIIGVVAFAVDVTEQKNSEAKLQETSEQFQAQNNELRRMQAFLDSTLDQLENAVLRGATSGELMRYINQARETALRE